MTDNGDRLVWEEGGGRKWMGKVGNDEEGGECGREIHEERNGGWGEMGGWVEEAGDWRRRETEGVGEEGGGRGI